MTLDESLANLQRQADRLAGHFSAIADSIEAGEGTFRARKDAAGELSRTELIYDPNGGDWNHTHQGYHGEGQAVEVPPQRDDHWDPTREYRDGPNGVELVPTAAEAAVLANPHVSEAIEQTFAGTAETVQVDWRNQTPQGAAPSSTQTTAIPTAGAVEVEGPGVGAPEAPRPAAPNPFETAPTAAAPPTEKKKGRRTHEELAADAGVSLADVKRWLGDKKVTKAAIEEYASLARANAIGETPDQAAITTPPDGSHLPQAVSDPFGQAPAPQQPAAPGFDVPPSTGAGAHVAATQMDYSQQPAAPAPQWPTGPDGQPLPVSQPVAQAQAAAGVPPTPDNPFGQTAENPWAGEQPVTDWSPFQ